MSKRIFDKASFENSPVRPHPHFEKSANSRDDSGCLIDRADIRAPSVLCKNFIVTTSFNSTQFSFTLISGRSDGECKNLI
jgi:hypothetical protein